MTYADDAKMRQGLRAPFPPEQIGKLPATAKRPELDYCGHAAVTDRLNKEAPDWSYSISPVVVRGTITGEGRDRRFVPDETGLPHVMAVFGTMTVGGVTRQEVGDVESFTTYGDELKKAISDFIRRGAMRFGVALDLWSKEDLNYSVAAGIGEKTQGAIGDTSRPAADEPGTRVGLGEGTSAAPGSTIPESEVTDAAPAHTNAPPSDDREHATPEQWNRLLELVGNEAKAVPIAAKTLGRSMTRTALAMLTQAEMTKVIEGAMA